MFICRGGTQGAICCNLCTWGVELSAISHVVQQKAGKQGRDDSTTRLVSLEYRNALEGMAHLALPLQYVLQSTCSPSAVPERFTNVDACHCECTSLAYNFIFCHLQVPANVECIQTPVEHRHTLCCLHLPYPNFSLVLHIQRFDWDW